MKTMMLLLFMSILSRALVSQNLVPNPSFEGHKTCEFIQGAIDTNYYTPPVVNNWCSGNFSGSPDYYHTCQVINPYWNYSVPINNKGYQQPVTGDAYAGISLIFYVSPTIEGREYLQTKLKEKLKKGISYCIGFYCSFPELDSSIAQGETIVFAKNWGMLLSDNRPFNPTDATFNSPPTAFTLIGTPQVMASDFIKSTTDWTLVSGIFTASGNEEWITIGNFNSPGQTPLDTLNQGTSLSRLSYYYIDNVFVIPMNDGRLLPSDTLVCGVAFPLSLSAAAGFTDYQWSQGDTTRQSSVPQPGFYSLRATYEGCALTDTIFIDTLPPPELHLSGVRYCESDLPKTYSLPDSPVFNAYNWSDGSTGRTISVERSGNLVVAASGLCGTASDTLRVVLDSVLAVDLGPDRSLCQDGVNVPLELSNAGSDLPVYQWSTGDTTQRIQVAVPGLYALYTKNGCGVFSDEIMLTGCAPAVYIPNVFSPSSSVAENTRFRAYAANAEVLRLDVYDRWGSLVFREQGDGPGWDGRWKGARCVEGIYLYVLEYRSLENGTIQRLTGTVTLLQ